MKEFWASLFDEKFKDRIRKQISWNEHMDEWIIAVINLFDWIIWKQNSKRSRTNLIWNEFYLLIFMYYGMKYSMMAARSFIFISLLDSGWVWLTFDLSNLFIFIPFRYDCCCCYGFKVSKIWYWNRTYVHEEPTSFILKNGIQS